MKPHLAVETVRCRIVTILERNKGREIIPRKIKWDGKEFIYEIDSNEKLCPQILSYLQGINFLYTMKLFYT